MTPTWRTARTEAIDHARHLRSVITVTASCLHCGGPLRLDRQHTHHPARGVGTYICHDCTAEYAIRIEQATITAPAPTTIDQRARDYRARKKAQASA
jgi:hypothetical protein